MRKIFCLVAGLVMFATVPALGKTIDLRTYKCSEYVKLPVDTQDLVVTWLDGYLADDEAADGLTVDFGGTDAEYIAEQCKKTPDATLLKAVEDAGAEPAPKQ